jgi:hypothetical protein
MMKRRPPRAQIVVEHPEDFYEDPEVEGIILSEEEVLDEGEEIEPGCIFDPLLGEE